MKSRTAKFATFLSTLMLGVSMLLFVLGYFLNPRDHHLSFGESFYVGLMAWGADSRIAFFSHADGPYQGSIMGLCGSNGGIDPSIKQQRAFGDLCGIYYRYFRWSDDTLWTVAVSLWIPIIVFGILPARRFLALVKYCRITRFKQK